jgi:hypothetical protein
MLANFPELLAFDCILDLSADDLILAPLVLDLALYAWWEELYIGLLFISIPQYSVII